MNRKWRKSMTLFLTRMNTINVRKLPNYGRLQLNGDIKLGLGWTKRT